MREVRRDSHLDRLPATRDMGDVRRPERPADQPIRLSGFNNLTKSVGFNLYDFVVARNDAERASYLEYIDARYSAATVATILEEVARIIDAEVLSISSRDYDPHGASAMVLVGDQPSLQRSVAAHLTKSHLCAHTYPDWTDPKGICSFRVDIDIATCGTIVPLRALDYMFSRFASDVVVIDYTVRGFTRDEAGHRVYLDHELRSIQDFIAPDIRADYHCEDLVLHREHIWQTRMMRTRLDAPEYFAPGVYVDDEQTRAALDDVRREMLGIFRGWPT